MKYAASNIIRLVVFLAVIAACQTSPYQQGKVLYNSYCANCHMKDGSGLQGLIPPIDGADYLTKHLASVPCIIRYGASHPMTVNGVTYSMQEMPANPNLTEAQIANILNYMTNSWNNKMGFTPLDSVYQWLERCPND